MSPSKPRPDGAPPSSVRLPHPRGVSRSVARASKLRPYLGVIAALSAGSILFGGVALGAVGVALAGAITLPIAFGAWARSRTLSVLIDENTVVLPDGRSLPKGQGNLLVESITRTMPSGRHYYAYQLSHSTAGVFEDNCRQPLVARACMEGLASAGGWPVVWRPLGDDDERREPTELDMPLAVREAVEPTIPRPAKRPSTAVYDVEERLDGAVLLRTRADLFHGGEPGEGWVPVMLVAAMLGLAVGARVGWWVPVVVAACFVPLWLLRSPDVEVSSSGITKLYRFLGGAFVWKRRVPSSKIESLYVEAVPATGVVAAGDGFHTTVASGIHTAEAEWLRGVIARALVGKGDAAALAAQLQTRTSPAEDRAATADAVTAGAASDVPSEGTCPTCAYVGLARVGGSLDEHRCPACGGRLLAPHGSERLVEGELGITRDMLRDLAAYFAGERRFCPSCRSRMSAVRLKGVMADLCQGCGGLWLDAGELSSLSRGRYEG